MPVLEASIRQQGTSMAVGSGTRAALQQTQHFCSTGKDLVVFRRMKYRRGIQIRKRVAPRNVPALSRISEAC